MLKHESDVTIVLDRSGSMGSIVSDVIGGFNQFLSDQQAQPGECRLSLVQFDNVYEVVYAGRPIADVERLGNKTAADQCLETVATALRGSIKQGPNLNGVAGPSGHTLHISEVLPVQDRWLTALAQYVSALSPTLDADSSLSIPKEA